MKTSSIASASPRRAANRGMSLVEMLVAIGIGTLIVAAMALLFANNSRSRSETERASRNIENGRFSLEVLRGELFHAGYFAELDPRGLALPTLKPDPCATTFASVEQAMGLHVQGYDNIAASTLSCLNDVKVGTDAVVVRRVSGCTVANPAEAGCTGLGTNALAFQASSCASAAELGSGDVTKYYKLSSDIGTLNRTKRNCTSTAPIRRYVLRIYYVANNDKPGDGIPTLKYAELGGAGFSASSLVQGVENLQIEYGLDVDGNGDADVYTAAPDLYLGCSDTTNPTCVGRWVSVVSAKIFVLSRSVEAAAGHVDSKKYYLGRKADGTPNEFIPAQTNYKRSVFQEVIRLQNASGRRATA